MGVDNKKISGIVADEPELNQLFQEALSGIRDDLNEAQQNVNQYLDAINTATGGKEMYGDLYNKALDIKGKARDRQLKFIDMFKDRVTKKEIINSNTKKETDIPFDHSQLNKMIDDVNQEKKLVSKSIVSPVLQILHEEKKYEEIVHDDELDEVIEDEDEDYDHEYD